LLRHWWMLVVVVQQWDLKNRSKETPEWTYFSSHPGTIVSVLAEREILVGEYMAVQRRQSRRYIIRRKRVSAAPISTEHRRLRVRGILGLGWAGYAAPETANVTSFAPMEISLVELQENCEGEGPDVTSRPVTVSTLAALRTTIARPYKGAEGWGGDHGYGKVLS
jgi:hypothetical protein